MIFFVYSIWSLWASWFAISIKCGHFSAIMSSNIVSIPSSSSGTLVTRILNQLVLSHMSLMLCYFVQSSLFLHHILDNFYCYVLKFTDLFFCTANLLLISVFFTSKVLVQSFSYLSLMLVFLMSAYNLFITVILLSLSANLTAFYWLIFLLVTIIFSCFSACLVIFIRCWTLKLFYIVGCWILQHHFKYSWGFVLEMQLSYLESVRAGVWWSFSPWLIQPFTN